MRNHGTAAQHRISPIYALSRLSRNMRHRSWSSHMILRILAALWTRSTPRDIRELQVVVFSHNKSTQSSFPCHSQTYHAESLVFFSLVGVLLGARPSVFIRVRDLTMSCTGCSPLLRAVRQGPPLACVLAGMDTITIVPLASNEWHSWHSETRKLNLKRDGLMDWSLGRLEAVE